MQLSEKQELVRLLGLYQSELLMENEENLRKKMLDVGCLETSMQER